MEITVDTVGKAVRIVRWPDPVLRRSCDPVDRVDGNAVALAARMWELMLANAGYGLAAPQVGVPARMFTWRVGLHNGAVVNPSLEEAAGESAMAEGCLSLPGVSVSVVRAESVTLVGTTPEGAPLRLRGEGLLARVWQHEMDHLDGLTLAERMSDAEGICNRRAVKRLKADHRKAGKAKGKRKRR